MNQILKKVASFFLVGTLALSMVACGGSTQTPTSSAATETKTATESVFRLTRALTGGANDSLPNLAGQNAGGVLSYLLFRPLVKMSGVTKDYVADLAEKWEVSEDYLSFTFELKKDLKWSDGAPLTAADVRFTLEAFLKASVIDSIYPEYLIKIEGAKAFKEGTAESISGLTIEDNKITIKLEEKSGVFFDVLAQVLIMPEHILKTENLLELHNSDFWKMPVSSGLYKVKEIKAAQYIELVKNEHYEGKAAQIDKVVLTYVNDPILSMENGEMYYHFTPRLQEIEKYRTLPFLKEYDADVLFYRYFVVNLSGHKGEGQSAVADKRVREALLYGIDRQMLVDTLMKKTVQVNHSGVPVNMPEYDTSLNTYAYNPEKAKELLKEAGFDFSKTFKITYYHSDQTTVNFIEAVAQQLRDLGMTVETHLITGKATEALFKTRDYDLGFKGFSSFNYESWYGEYSSKSKTFSNVYNADNSFDEGIIKLAGETDKEARVKILKELQALEQEKLHKLPMFTSKAYIYINADKVQIPEDMNFLNPWYHYDLRFEEWKMK